MKESTLDEARSAIEELVFDMFRLAIDEQASPRIEVSSEMVGSVMFSSGRVERFDEREPEILGDLAENPRVNRLPARSASASWTASLCPS